MKPYRDVAATPTPYGALKRQARAPLVPITTCGGNANALRGTETHITENTY